MSEILEVKKGNINVSYINQYVCLQNQLKFFKERLTCLLNARFLSTDDDFVIGRKREHNTENKDFIVLGNGYYIKDNKEYVDDTELKQNLVRFLVEQTTDKINEITARMNEFIV